MEILFAQLIATEQRQIDVALFLLLRDFSSL